MCERCGQRVASQVHHLAGKEGENLVRPKNLGGLCDPCHNWVHANPADARIEGWMLTRHGSPSDTEDEEQD